MKEITRITPEMVNSIYEILAPYLGLYRNATEKDGYTPLNNALEYYFHKYPELRFPSAKCPICGCLMSPKDPISVFKNIRKTIGGHIYSPKGRNIYILPICEACNHRTDWFKINTSQFELLIAP